LFDDVRFLTAINRTHNLSILINRITCFSNYVEEIVESPLFRENALKTKVILTELLTHFANIFEVNVYIALTRMRTDLDECYSRIIQVSNSNKTN